MRLTTASHMYDISALSLRDHAYGTTRSQKRGGKNILSSEKESQLVNWILNLQHLGHTILLTTLRMKAAEICETRVTPYTDGIPD